jgi:hypothetical protein
VEEGLCLLEWRRRLWCGWWMIKNNVVVVGVFDFHE